MAIAHLSYTVLSTFLSALLLLLPFADARRHAAFAKLQSRAPHGLAFENPMPFPPSAFEFFHPRALPPASSPMPLSSSSFYPAATSAKVRADEAAAATAAGGVSSPPRHGGVGASGVAAMVLGLAFVVFAAMAASYTVVRRRAEVKRGMAIVQPDA